MNRRHAVALWFLLVLADNAVMVRLAIGPLLGVESLGGVHWIATAWLVATTGTVVAILLHPRLAVLLIAPLILMSTIFLAIPFIPFIMDSLPRGIRPYLLLPVNIAALAATTWLLWGAGRRPTPPGLTGV